ncbi:MAG: (2Fe-2S) ferredoxin domain-containing protein [Rhodospirillaceae bacterium]|nr:(2Fe-2S) ferredoxin domain-containing protein [Rhodospirillaceae bacterium]
MTDQTVKRPMGVHLRKVREAPTPAIIRVCVNKYQPDGSANCGGRGGQEMHDLLAQGIQDRDIDIQFRALDCLGMCQRGPAIMLDPGNGYFLHAQPEDVPEILNHVETFVAEVKELRQG